MTRDRALAVLSALAGVAASVVTMAAPSFLKSHYAPSEVPNWVWLACTYGGGLIFGPCVLLMLGFAFWPSETQEVLQNSGLGGRGGNAKVVGRNSRAQGGAGGQGGVGQGGAGGDAEVAGDNSVAIGGDGGNAAQADGRGGRRTRSPAEVAGYPTELWKYGYGGVGGNLPEYNRRLQVLIAVRDEYMNMFPDEVVFIKAGIDQVPTAWVNKRLEEMGEAWRIDGECLGGGYVMPPLLKVS